MILAMTPDKMLHMKPQNLLTGLPIRPSETKIDVTVPALLVGIVERPKSNSQLRLRAMEKRRRSMQERPACPVDWRERHERGKLPQLLLPLHQHTSRPNRLNATRVPSCQNVRQRGWDSHRTECSARSRPSQSSARGWCDSATSKVRPTQARTPSHRNGRGRALPAIEVMCGRSLCRREHSL